MAVVDSDHRVFGVRNLRVVDVSTFPFLVPGHPQSTVCESSHCFILATFGESSQKSLCSAKMLRVCDRWGPFCSSQSPQQAQPLL